jgi:hypothetical protein
MFRFVTIIPFEFWVYLPQGSAKLLQLLRTLGCTANLSALRSSSVRARKAQFTRKRAATTAHHKPLLNKMIQANRKIAVGKGQPLQVALPLSAALRS